MISLQELRDTYGDFSAISIINRWENFQFGKNNFTDLPNKNLSPEIEFDEENFSEPVQDFKISKPSRTLQTVEVNFNQNYFPSTISQTVQKNKFSPINIASLKDWAELRVEALDLHELKNFFVGKSDSQSPQFINLIDNYKKSVEKNLARSKTTAEDYSNDFVAKLAEVIEKRFYKILKSCRRGKLGKGEMPKNYYFEIEERIKKYFERIGLKSENVKQLDNFRQWQDHMKVLDEVPVSREHFNKKIYEVEIQPHYFEYHSDDGEIEKFYIDGECTVYKFSN